MTAKDRYQAGRTDLVYWLRSHGEALKRSGSEWEWKYHDERVTIRGHLWFDQYTQVGGDAVKFLQYFDHFTVEIFLDLDYNKIRKSKEGPKC